MADPYRLLEGYIFASQDLHVLSLLWAHTLFQGSGKDSRETHPLKKVSGISVCIPAYNEEGNIGTAIATALEVLPEYAEEFEVIVVDDGSTDGTKMVADQWAEKDRRVKVSSYQPNRGIGAALRTAFQQVSKSHVFFISSDNQYDFHELKGFIEAAGSADMVVGYLPDRVDPLVRRLLSRSYHLVIQLRFGLKLRNINCIKFFKREVLDAVVLRSEGPFIDAELLIRAKRKGFTISEIPVKHFPRPWGKQRGSSVKAVLRTLKELFRLRSDL